MLQCDSPPLALVNEILDARPASIFIPDEKTGDFPLAVASLCSAGKEIIELLRERDETGCIANRLNTAVQPSGGLRGGNSDANIAKLASKNLIAKVQGAANLGVGVQVLWKSTANATPRWNNTWIQSEVIRVHPQSRNHLYMRLPDGSESAPVDLNHPIREIFFGILEMPAVIVSPSEMTTHEMVHLATTQPDAVRRSVDGRALLERALVDLPAGDGSTTSAADDRMSDVVLQVVLQGDGAAATPNDSDTAGVAQLQGGAVHASGRGAPESLRIWMSAKQSIQLSMPIFRGVDDTILIEGLSHHGGLRPQAAVSVCCVSVDPSCAMGEVKLSDEVRLQAACVSNT